MSTSSSNNHPDEGRKSLLPVNDFELLIDLLKQANEAATADNRWHLAGRTADAVCALLADDADRKYTDYNTARLIESARHNMPRLHPAPHARTAGDTPAGEEPYPALDSYNGFATLYPYVCLLCPDRSFVDSEELAKHMNDSHQADPRDEPPHY